MTTSPKNEGNKGLHKTYKFFFMKNEMKFWGIDIHIATWRPY
jgi:hypothetical protein